MRLFAILLVMGLSVAANAARPAYTFAGLAYVQDRFTSGNECTQDGVLIEGSLVLNELFFVRGRHVDVTSDDDWCGSTTTSVSSGFHSTVGMSSSLYGLATILIQDSGNDTDPGVGLETGVRTMFRGGIEGKVFIGYEIIDDLDESYLGVGFNKGLSRRWSLFGDLSTSNEDKTGISLGFRFNF